MDMGAGELEEQASSNWTRQKKNAANVLMGKFLGNFDRFPFNHSFIIRHWLCLFQAL